MRVPHPLSIDRLCQPGGRKKLQVNPSLCPQHRGSCCYSRPSNTMLNTQKPVSSLNASCPAKGFAFNRQAIVRLFEESLPSTRSSLVAFAKRLRPSVQRRKRHQKAKPQDKKAGEGIRIRCCAASLPSPKSAPAQKRNNNCKPKVTFQEFTLNPFKNFSLKKKKITIHQTFAF